MIENFDEKYKLDQLVCGVENISELEVCVCA